MATRKTTKKTSLATHLMLTVLSLIVAAIAYKQIFLVSQVSSTIPQEGLTQALQRCVQNNLTPQMLKQGWAGEQLNSQLNFDVKSLLGDMFSQVSQNLMDTTITQNYMTEVKVMKVDWFGKQAQMRVTGSIDLTSKAPVIGSIKAQKDYQTQVFKRDNSYYFDTLSIKKRDSQQWDEWTCAQTL